jgi:hypothetical protein
MHLKRGQAAGVDVSDILPPTPTFGKSKAAPSGKTTSDLKKAAGLP